MGVSKKRQDEIAKYLSKENLEKAFQEGYSANYIAKKYFAPHFQTDAATVIEHAKKHSVKTNTLKESACLKTVKQLKQTTCLENYGYENPSQAQIIKDKKEQKALEKYGVKNVFQAEEIKQKIYATCKEKYGCEKLGGSGIFTPSTRSKFQVEIEKRLTKLNLRFESEVGNCFTKFNDHFNRIYNPIVDILLEQYKLVIECYGDIWHANPTIYQPSDKIILFDGPTLAKDIWTKDQKRIEQIESFGYVVMVIWYKDWHHNKQKVENEIKNKVDQQIIKLSNDKI